MKNRKLATKVTIFTLILLALGLSAIWLETHLQTTAAMKESVTARLSDSVASGYEIANDFVEMAESYLIGFAQAPILSEYFLDMDNVKMKEKLQAYTVAYASVNKNIENIYSASIESVVQSSFVPASIGVQFRTGDALKALQDEVFDKDGIWNIGIMASKSTGAPVVSMYYPVTLPDSTPLGYVGGAIYAEDLKNTLKTLSSEGCSYMLLDIPNNAYIFHPDDALIGATIEDTQTLAIIENAITGQNPIEIYDDKTSETLAATKYDAERGWILVALTDYEHAFGASNKTTTMLALRSLLVLVVCSGLTWFLCRRVTKDFTILGKTIEDLGTLDLTNRSRLSKYLTRKDEVGVIAKAADNLAGAVTIVVKDLASQAVVLEDTAQQMSENAVSVNESLKGVELAVEEISQGAGEQASETQKASDSVVNMGNMIKTTADKMNELNDTNNRIKSASENARATLRALTKINEDAKISIEEINKQTKNTNESAQSIRGAAEFITSIAEETNLLSLNASLKQQEPAMPEEGLQL